MLRARAGFYDVLTEQGEFQAQLRGTTKRESEPIAVGDRVELSLEDGAAMVEAILPRQRVLSRQAPGREVEQVLVANPDQVVLVFACADPDPNFRLLDRLLVTAESQELPAVIIANKTDLVVRGAPKAEFGEYERIGYPVHYTSATKGKGLRGLKKRLKDKTSVFVGPSGAGKSTLLNAIQPDLDISTAEVSDVGLGTHTTVVRELHPLEGGGYLVDMPGVRAFALWDIEPEELDGYFPELAARVDQCEFSDCTHTHEPGCAVTRAVQDGDVSPERYDSYLRMREGVED